MTKLRFGILLYPHEKALEDESGNLYIMPITNTCREQKQLETSARERVVYCGYVFPTLSSLGK